MAANSEIKLIAASKGVKQWEIANAIGVSEGKFCRMMRTELSQELKTTILSVIENISNGESVSPSYNCKEEKLEPQEECLVISSRIKSILELTGTTQTELGKRTGILPNTISCFCNGSRIPNAIHIIKIADAFNVSADYILGRTEMPQKDVNTKELQIRLNKIIRCINEVMDDATP